MIFNRVVTSLIFVVMAWVSIATAAAVVHVSSELAWYFAAPLFVCVLTGMASFVICLVTAVWILFAKL